MFESKKVKRLTIKNPERRFMQCVGVKCASYLDSLRSVFSHSGQMAETVEQATEAAQKLKAEGSQTTRAIA